MTRFGVEQPPPVRDVLGRDDVLALQEGTGRTLDDLVALSRKNDPFLTGKEMDWTKARWITDVTTELSLAGTHQRGVHYALVSHRTVKPDGTLYSGTPADEKLLVEAVAAARQLGLLPRDVFPDRKSIVIVDAAHEREYEAPAAEIHEPTATLPTLYEASWCPTSLSVSRPTPLQSQPVVIEILTEKDGIVSDLVPLAREYGCRLEVARGYTGKSAAAEILNRAIRDGRPLIVLMFHDADSAGESMGISTARHLEFYVRQAEAEGVDVPPIYVDVVGVTLEQVSEIERETSREIPRAPDVKREQGRVELDALPYFAPGWIERELRRRLEELSGHVDYNLLDDAEEALEADVEAMFDPLERRIQEITVEANELLQTPYARALRHRLLELRAALASVVAEAPRVEAANELPDPEVYGPDFDAIDWLFDPRRDYLEQLNAYRRREPIHRRRPEIKLEERPPCECGCGRDMRGRKPGARFFDGLCRARWNNGRRPGRAR